MEWTSWLENSKIDMQEYINFNFEELIIPTPDSERNAYFVKSMILNG